MILSEQRERQLQHLELFLRSHHYLPAAPETGVMIAALAKWFHVNQLGELTLFPFYKALTEAFERLELPPSRGSGLQSLRAKAVQHSNILYIFYCIL